MTWKNNRAHLLYCVKFCASFQSHQWIQTWVIVRKRSIRVKIDDVFSRVTLQFDVWPWKIIGQLFYASSSFVNHFVTIGELKPELQSAKAQFGSKSICFSYVTLQFDVWSFRSHWWIQTEVTHWKRPIGVKFDDFLDGWPWNLTGDLENNRAPLQCYFKLCASFVTIGEFILELQSGNAQFGPNSTMFWAVWPWNLTDDLEKQ